MKTIQSCKMIAAGLLAAAMLSTQLASQASTIVGPYTADANTLHLWHINASAAPVPDAVSSGGVNLATLANGAILGTNTYSGFGTGLNTLDGGQDAVAAGNKDAYLAASASAVTITLADSTGAFTFEALVRIGFDPAKNLGPTAGGGNNRQTFCQIMTGEGTVNANRWFQWRIAPIGTDTGNTAVKMDLVNVNAGGTSQKMSMNLPTTGADAIASNSWYHVAVAYNGAESTANNITFYWTLLDASRTNASVLGSTQMNLDLPTGQTIFSVGNLAGRTPVVGNFLGLIDEVRISNVARGSNQMMFFGPVRIASQPADQSLATGQPANFSVTATGLDPLTYQWRLYGTNLSTGTQSAYPIAAVQASDAGPYDVVVANTFGSLTSTVANLTIRPPLNLTWRGLTDSNWDASTTNWVTDASANAAYATGDNVTFDNSGSGFPVVSLIGSLAPSSVVVNAANDYTLNSSVGGGIAGPTGLAKSGAGTLVLDTDNSYTGPTVIQGGILQLGAADAHGTLGTGPVTNNAAMVVNRTGAISFNNTLAGSGSLTNLLGATISIGGLNTLSGPIVLNAGTLSLAGPQAAGNSANLILNASAQASGATVLLLSGSVALGSGVTLSMLGTTDVPDFRCTVTTGSDASINVLNGPVVLGGSGAVQVTTTANNELDLNGSISAPDFTGKLIFRGSAGVCHLYGTINLPNANAVSRTDTGGTLVIHSTGNSWTNSNLASGTLRLAVNDALPTGVVLSIGGGATLDLAGFNQQVGVLTSGASGNRIIGNSSTTADSILTVADAGSSFFGGVIQDSVSGGTRKVGLILTGGGTLTLSNVCTYTGDTAINAGTLALTGSGSLNSTAGTISIAAGATFDVSGVTTPPYHVRTGKTLSGGGVSGGATINGALVENGGGFLALTYVSGTPAINVTGGELTLSGCDTTVTVSGAALDVGNYKLISAGTAGSVAGTLPSSVTVAGSGLAANTLASLRITGGELWLDVVSAVVPQPVVSSVSYDGSNLIMSGNNGTAGHTYYVLASPVLAGPLSGWERVSTNVFEAGGLFSVTNPVSPVIPVRFYVLQVP